jgi:murein DD-endopeptidase MepM/ murein hydrolase activator NlpD
VKNSIIRPLFVSGIVLLSLCGQSSAAVEKKPISTKPTHVKTTAVASPSDKDFYVVQPKDTLYSIAKKHGMNVKTLAELNNIKEPYGVKIGTKLKFSSSAKTSDIAAKKQAAAAATKQVEANAAQAKPKQTKLQTKPTAIDPRSHDVLSKDLSVIQTKPAIAATVKKPDAANDVVLDKETLKKPKTSDKSSSLDDKAEVKDASLKADDKPTDLISTAQKGDDFDEVMAFVNSSYNKNDIIPVKKPQVTPEKFSEKTIEVNASGLSSSGFSWPTNGKVVSHFGPKQGGLYNDGINIAAKDGSIIKAVDNGTVLYSGNELRGYGNLVLVRHDNGFVTAYAHAKELLVKKGDDVTKGQTIGYVGNTGNVSEPQLHFSVRKGRKAIDPEKYLTGKDVKI